MRTMKAAATEFLAGKRVAVTGVSRKPQRHRGPGSGSVSPSATAYGREHGLTVIDRGCPCMFVPTADTGHKAMRFVLTLSGNVPRRV
jgi:hypothetical protein